MNLSAEITLLIIINLISAGIFIGGLEVNVKIIEEQIKRLEKKQDKHNCLIERMTVVEQSVKSAHHRIDGMENLINKFS